MIAIVLAAGYGTRLYPLTIDTPKPLLPIAGKPLIEHILYRIEELGAKEIIIVTNNKFYGKFNDWGKNYKSKTRIRILNDHTNSNDDRLGAIGDIDYAVKQGKIDDDILVIAGDNLFDFSLIELHRLFREKNASVVALHDLKDRNKAAGKYGIAEINHDARITGFHEKPAEPKTALASTACYFFTKKDLDELERCIKTHKKPDNLGEFVKWLAERKHVYGCVFEEKWFDIGSHDQLMEADEHWKRKKP